MKQLGLTLVERTGKRVARRLPVAQVLLAGYTGRDRAGVLAHIRELEEFGVAPPPRVPMVYEVSPDLLTTGRQVRVGSAETSGEVEFCMLSTAEGLLVGVGSDHTDRAQEAVDVAHSKTLCAKVVSAEVWRYADVQDHWDQLEIRSWMTVDGQRRLYQQGTLGAFLGVDDVLAELRQAGYETSPPRVIFGGTIPALEGFAYGQRFEVELLDPVLRRRLTGGYDVIVVG